MEPSIRKVLFHAASSLASPDERRVFLDQVCRDDPGLRKHLDKLLELQRAADMLFDLQPEVYPEPAASGDEGLGASIGRYRLIERIGEGGHGVVYLAEQQEPVRRKVALKVIRLGMDTESVIARFEAERQALALMDHPNIARVFDAGATASGRPYFVMELVDGEPITEFCKAADLGLRQRLELFVQVCQAIQHAHQKGVVHRDIKPSNVLVSRHDGAPVPKVIDFGIAKAASPGGGENLTVTVAGHFVGTPAYMSPEQASGGMDVDTRTDIYSLGVLLYELMVGRPPFDAKRLTHADIEETRRILRDEEPPPPSRAAGRGKTNDLDWIVMKAMAKERSRRYDTANGLSFDVTRFLEDEPVAARPPSRGYRLGKLVRRNKVTFAAGSIAVFGLVAGFGVSTWLFIREKSAREEQVRLSGIAARSHRNETKLREGAEFREQVAQAAVQLGRGNLEEADRLLGRIPVERTPVSLEAAECYRRIAEWHVVAGRIADSADRYASLVNALSNVDDSDSSDVSFHLMPTAAALCHAGKTAEYERVRNFAIGRFSETENPQVAEQLLKASLLGPADRATLRRLDTPAKLVEQAVNDPGSWIANSPYLAAWSCFVLGLKCFREGDYAKATVWIHRCLSYPQENEPKVASSRLILAIIDSHEGRKGNAQLGIEMVQDPVEKAMSGTPGLGTAGEGFWFDWVNARLLLDEARQALAP